MPYKKGELNITELLDDEAALLACFGDPEAVSEIWERMIPLVESVTAKFRKYWWIDQDDLTQAVLLEFPKIIKRFKPSKGKTIKKYLYYSFYRATQDALRKEDPLGVMIPQKKHYPEWHHLGAFFDGLEHRSTFPDEIAADGMGRIDKGYPCRLPDG